MTSGKGSGVKAEKKIKKKDGDSDEEQVPYDQMTEEQKRIFDVQVFHRTLDRSKTYFGAMRENIIPIVEAVSVDEESIISKPEAQEAQVMGTIDSQNVEKKVEETEKKKKKKKEKESDEESGSEDEEEGSGDDDEEKKAKKQKTKKKKKEGDGSEDDEDEDGDEKNDEDKDSEEKGSDDEKDKKSSKSKAEESEESESD